jgi:hypothetical protein
VLIRISNSNSVATCQLPRIARNIFQIIPETTKSESMGFASVSLGYEYDCNCDFEAACRRRDWLSDRRYLMMQRLSVMYLYINPFSCLDYDMVFEDDEREMNSTTFKRLKTLKLEAKIQLENQFEN